MKTMVKIAFLALMTIVIIQPAHGQRILKKLKEKVEEKVEKRVDKKVDETIDNELDKAEESLENKKEAGAADESGITSQDEQREQRMQRMLKGIGISGEPIPVEDSYSFNNLIEMHMESINKNGTKEDEGEFITHFSPQSKNMAYEIVSGNIGEPGQGLFIIDLKNEAIIILGEEKGEKTGLVYGIGAFFEAAGESEESTGINETPETYLTNPKVTRTGRTKTIAGYKCEEYKHADEESESFIWITKDLQMNSRDFFSTLFKTSLYSQGIPWGYIMEVTTTDKQTGEKSFMQVTRIEENVNTRFSLADYKITNLGSFKIPAQE